LWGEDRTRGERHAEPEPTPAAGATTASPRAALDPVVNANGRSGSAPPTTGAAGRDRAAVHEHALEQRDRAAQLPAVLGPDPGVLVAQPGVHVAGFAVARVGDPAGELVARGGECGATVVPEPKALDLDARPAHDAGAAERPCRARITCSRFTVSARRAPGRPPRKSGVRMSRAASVSRFR
jgi:hypothetical protein